MKKRKMFQFVCWIMLLAISFSAIASAVGIEISEDALLNGRILLLTIPVGENESELSIDDSLDTIAWGKKGPESFVILNNGNFAILDSVADRIAIYEPDGTFSESVEFSCPEGDVPVLFANNGDEYCIIVRESDETGFRETDGHYVLFVDSNGTARVSLDFDIVKEDNTIEFVEYTDDGVVTLVTNRSDYINVSKNGAEIIVSYANDLYSDSKKFTELDGTTIEFTTCEAALPAYFTGRKANGNIIVYEHYYIGSSRFAMIIMEYNTEGIVVSNKVIENWSDNYTHPANQLYFAPDETICYMEITKTCVNIYRMVLNECAEQNLTYIIPEIETEMTVTDIQGETYETTATDTSYISLKRLGVSSRARYMASFTWSVSNANKVDGNDDVTVPPHVANATTGTLMTGIPYCWGGYNGYEDEGTSTKLLAFRNIVGGTSGVTAGNIDCDGGHVSGTIGLDCSGYVSSAYNVGATKKSTGDFAGSFGNDIDMQDLRHMDYIVKSGYHIVLFDSFYNGSYDSGKMYIYDCTKNNNLNKTSRRLVSISEFSDWKYRTPWRANCVYGMYYHTDTTHYRTCTDCGYNLVTTGCISYTSNSSTQHTQSCSVCDYTAKSSHTIKYTASSSTHLGKCSLCGYKQTRQPHNFLLNDSKEYECQTCGYISTTNINEFEEELIK